LSAVLFAGGGTGGHLYPALALADALRAERPEVRVHFAGAVRGVEARVLPKHGEPHTLLPFQPIYRDKVWRNWRMLPALFASARGLSRLFRELRPGLVVGTGGYASGPACFWALLRGVPVAVQEQNSWPGLTTRLLARKARQVHLGFPEAERHLRPGPRTRIFALGNPIRPPDTRLGCVESRAQFGLSTDSVVALVVGGSQGSQALNEALLAAIAGAAKGQLKAWPASLEILWATGPAHIESIQQRLAPLGVNGWVHAVGYIDAMPRALASANVAVSRAGAMATAELLAWGIPTLLVPLPTAAADHQTHNARALADAGAAVFLPQAELSPERLWNELTSLVTDSGKREEMARAARSRARPNAARDIVRELLTLLAA
jgi:UDP-N-acetylglucosamine--N-acetylmuramyl-(pentapeptide) pyrophosphoryl-undecaprenol N-acetylglucosamine transferase